MKVTREVIDVFMANNQDLIRTFRLQGDRDSLYRIVKGCIKAEQAVLAEYKKDAFLDALTEQEFTALGYLVDAINPETHLVSISKVVPQTPTISIAVYRNLLAKMEQHQVARVQVRGMRGTQIDWLIEGIGAD